MSDAERGNIYNHYLARKAKEYAYHTIFHACNVAKDNHITPTDIEGVVERKGHFLYFEFKTEGEEMNVGQRRMYWARLNLDRIFGTLFVCEHPPLNTIDLGSDITSLTIIRWDEATHDLQQTRRMPVDNGGLKWWLDQWFFHVEGLLSEFIHQFRVDAGIYPHPACHLEAKP